MGWWYCGLKSILDVRNREKALQIMEELQKLDYITYTLEPGTTILTYRITDWVLKCSGAECCDGVVYTTDGYGFLCMPRNITDRVQNRGESLMSPMPGWICGVILSSGIMAMLFPLRHRQSSMASLVLY